MTAGMKRPELLVKAKKFNQMEMEMDKFLAKKQQIMHSLLNQTTPHEIRSSLLLSLTHILLKSLYENIRLYSFSLFGYQQL